MKNEVRKVTPEDIPALKKVLHSTQLFPAEMLDEMIADYFNNPDSQDIWFTCVRDNEPVSIGFCAPEKFTQGTFNLYAIAVMKELQGNGIGAAMMRFIENLLRENGHRILIVETSGSSEFELTRKFYLKNGYTHEATIHDFWQMGEDKIIFWKKLN